MSSSTYSASPNPAIEIKEIGAVGLPLSLRDVDAVKQASHLAPFGKGSETLVDESVRKTWEINASDVKLRNPKWVKWVQSSILPLCAEKLGVPLATRPFIKAELYKLLLYEEGAHFKPHRDSEKAPGMFATLAICLPSQFEGGELVLEFGEERLTWDSSKSSLADVSVAAWYADVTHEVKPITKGHRMVLTYNVINTQRAAVFLPTAEILTQADRDFAQILRRWNTYCDDTPDFLCHFLDHKYTEESLRLSRLVGKDQAIVTQAARVAERTNNAVLYLATFEHMRSGSCDDDNPKADIDEVFNSHTRLQKLVKLDGSEVATDVDINETAMVQTVAFEELDPDDEDYQGHTGNAGAEKTLWYRKAVLAMIRRRNRVHFMARRVFEGTVCGETFAKQLLEKYKNATNKWGPQNDMQAFCRMMVLRLQRDPPNNLPGRYSRHAAGSTMFSADFKALLIICGVWMGDEELCRSVLSTMKGSIRSGILAELHDPLMANFPKFQQLLTDALCRMETVTDVWQCLQRYLDTDSQNTQLFEWSKAVLGEFLASTSLMAAADAHTLVVLSARYGEDVHDACIVPCALRHSSQAWFSLAFAVEVFESWHATPSYDGKRQCPDLSNEVSVISGGSEFQAAHLGDVAKRPASRFPHVLRPDSSSEGLETDSNGTPYGESQILHFTDPLVIVRLYHHLLALNKAHVSQGLMTRLLVSSHMLGTKAPSLYPKMLIPLATKLLQDPMGPPGHDSATSLGNTYIHFNAIWRFVLLDFVRQLPPSTSLAMRPIRCRCRDCALVSRFLTDAHKTQIKVLADKYRRQHLHQELDSSHYGTVTHETLRIGYPEPLIITKKSGATWKSQHIAWTKRAALAKESLLSIPQGKLKEALHNSFFDILPEATMKALFGESWEGLMPLNYAPRTTAVAVPELQVPSFAPNQLMGVAAETSIRSFSDLLQQMQQRQVQASNGAARSLVPAKRKAEVDVVDLTED